MAHVPNDWLIRVGDAENFWRSSKFGIWSANTTVDSDKYFLKTVAQGDRLWFVKSGGLLVAVGIYAGSKRRELGPIFSVTKTNEELGWDDKGDTSDTEIHYRDLIDIRALNLHSNIKGPLGKRLYNPTKCAVNLPNEFVYIQRYKDIVSVKMD